MAAATATVTDLMDEAWKLRDPRTKDWFMLSSPWPNVYLTVLYFLLVWLGPKVMRNRQAFSLREVMILYNIIITALSCWMFKEILLSALNVGYDWTCALMKPEDPQDIRMANVLWWYYFSKAFEFLDTLFFILRKNNHQITFLHVYHHASMFNIWWVVLNWGPTGQAFFGPLANSFVHIIMYTYYCLSAVPSLRPYLWWKKYITKLQLLQFFIVIFHTYRGIYKSCGYILWLQYFLGVYMFSLVALFTNFYMQSYIKKRPSSKDQKDVDKNKNVYQNGASAAHGKGVSENNGVREGNGITRRRAKKAE
ncbi:PREDICTED: elongation of very long chain fatty acids protein 2-like [Branchiostoma belcheri]|uniref:Elongation of very long chain fatty acids protein n=1 Tax=Branchiostoma belcheri TaxID=7741 RepID=A0A6P4ZAV8_BRABE|nr:PREDICTED: elongation of very long chain fatty acids protein 2-like [Branchiostoma belcheri]